MISSSVLWLVLASYSKACPSCFTILKSGCRPLSLERLNVFANCAAPSYVRSCPALLFPRRTWEHNGLLTEVRGRFLYGSSSAGCPLTVSHALLCLCSCKPHHHPAVLGYLSISQVWARTLLLTMWPPFLPRLSAHASLAPLQHRAKYTVVHPCITEAN